MRGYDNAYKQAHQPQNYSNFSQSSASLSNWQWLSISSAKGLMWNNPKVITKADDHPVHYCIHVSPGLNWINTNLIILISTALIHFNPKDLYTEFPGERALQWHLNECDGVSNHQPHNRSLNRFFRCRSKKTSKLHVTGLCEGNSPGTSEFPAHRASNAENVSIWWHHHEIFSSSTMILTCSIPFYTFDTIILDISCLSMPWHLELVWCHWHLMKHININQLPW